MGYPSRVQRIKRKQSEQYYVNVPSAIAYAMGITKGEVIEWSVENKTKLIIKRKRAKSLKPNQRAMHGRALSDTGNK